MLIYYENHALIKMKIFSWQKIIKRLLDITAAFSGLLFLSPLMIYVAIKIMLDSKGPIFYSQERIGRHGMPFTIFKFRSMYQHSEMNGPVLSSINDCRITKWGGTIRKWKLDELPQLLNILMGDMSLVGPRPERKHYIDKVSAKCPDFKLIHQVKPGLTSLGMIKFGYAHNVKQIIQRTQFDISYIKNYSLLLDFQIVYYTLCLLSDGKVSTCAPSEMTLFLNKVAASNAYSQNAVTQY